MRRKRRMKRIIAILCLMVMMISGVCPKATPLSTVAAANVPEIRGAGHVQNIGWMSEVNTGEFGCIGLNLESFYVTLNHNGNSMIMYRTHVQNEGWQSWRESGQQTGSTGKNQRIEDVEMKLKGVYAQMYDIYYRVYVKSVGWLGYACNGESAGSTSIGAGIEALEIRLVKKGDTSLKSSVAATIAPNLMAQCHVAQIGWMAPVMNDAIIGTIGNALRMEAVKLIVKDPYGNSNIRFRVHVAGIGWQDFVNSSEIGGTTGQSRAIEAIEIQLTGILAKYYDIYVRAHVSQLGWLGWAKNGIAGTTGRALPIEALQIKIVPKGTAFNQGGTAYYGPVSGTGNTSNAAGFDPIWPCVNTYNVTMLYKNSKGDNHGTLFKTGIDIGAPKGENVVAVESGTVITSEYSTTSGFGNWIMIQHDNGKVSLYAHLNSRKVSVGNRVQKGQVIGQVGNTSAKYTNMGAHLHFELGNSNKGGAAGDAYQEYYKHKYAGKISLIQAAAKYNTP